MSAPSEAISTASVQKSLVGPALGSLVGPGEGSGDGPGVTVGFNVGSRVSTGGANPSGATLLGSRQIDNSARAPVLSNETMTRSTSGSSTTTEIIPLSSPVLILPVLVFVSKALPFVYDVTLTVPETLNNLTKYTSSTGGLKFKRISPPSGSDRGRFLLVPSSGMMITRPISAIPVSMYHPRLDFVMCELPARA